MRTVLKLPNISLKIFLYVTGFSVALAFALLTLPVAALYYYTGHTCGSVLLRDYGWNLAIAIDQLSNTFLLGSTNETISGRVKRALLSGRPEWFVAPLGRFINRLAVLIASDFDHISKAEIVSNVEDELDSWIKKTESEG